MEFVQKTDIGRIRLVNEDRAVVNRDVNGLSLAIVADGMGGHQAGEVASQMAIETIQGQLAQLRSEMTVEEQTHMLRQAIRYSNASIKDEAERDDSHHGMGTTVVVAVLSPERIVLGHIGDSRAYLISGRHVEQLTEDHTLVNELVRSGQISRQEAEKHPRRNVLTRALGTESKVEADIRVVEWKQGDRLLLCSDGLSGMINHALLAETLASKETLEEISSRLLLYALSEGGEDNITLVLADNGIDSTQSIVETENKG